LIKLYPIIDNSYFQVYRLSLTNDTSRYPDISCYIRNIGYIILFNTYGFILSLLLKSEYIKTIYIEFFKFFKVNFIPKDWNVILLKWDSLSKEFIEKAELF